MMRLLASIVALTFAIILSTSLTFATDKKTTPGKPVVPAAEQKAPQAHNVDPLISTQLQKTS